MSNTVILVTSGSGKYEPAGIDSISSASKTKDIDNLVNKIVMKLDEIIYRK